jgi:hypothetical protein
VGDNKRNKGIKHKMEDGLLPEELAYRKHFD